MDLDMKVEEISSLTTKEFAALAKVEPGTIRHSHCIHGHYLSIRPIKLLNGQLRWPALPARKILSIDDQTGNR